MKARPILFSDAMVRAILDRKKTQTRRVVKIPTWGNDLFLGSGRPYAICRPTTCLAEVHCPYGVVGDRLWVRESGWERPERTPRQMRDGADTWPPYCYAADGENADELKAWGWKRRPSIHMPRWASRITLEIADVRVERVQTISERDAEAEGVAPAYERRVYPSAYAAKVETYRQGFSLLWDSINGKRPGCSWSDNPWVWVIGFNRL